MLKELLHKVLLRRHFWRYVTFSEVGELYVSRLLRMVAINISVVFVMVFLYQNGYTLLAITGILIGFFGFKALVALPMAAYAARFGPKHGILLSNLLYIPAMILFTLTPDVGTLVLVPALMLQGMSASLYNLCYLIDFSKVKSVEHAGKEMAVMSVVEKVAKGVSPFAGGVLAFLAGPQATLWAAAILFMLASLPLFKTGEPVVTHQKLTFRDFPWRLTYRALIAELAIGFDGLISGTMWSLFVVIAILGVSGNAVYAQLGALLSVVLLAAIAASYVYGRLIDNRRGGDLLRVSIVANSLTHLVRPFVTSSYVVAGVNVANEAATTGYMMAYTRGLFDTADLSKHRVAFLGLIGLTLDAGSCIAAAVLACMVSTLGEVSGLRSMFFIAAGTTFIVLIAKFRLYKK